MYTRFLASLCAVALLVACASAPAGPYWENSQWVNELGFTVRKGIQYPADMPSTDITSGNALIKFVYDNGNLAAPEILTSTGSKQLDQSILAQIPSIRPPLAQGKDTDVPHGFALLVTIYAKTQAYADPEVGKFFMAIHKALADQVRYPSAAVHNHVFGTVVVKFRYRDGAVTDAQITSSSGFKTLDDAVLNELQHAKLPPPPLAVANRTLTFSEPLIFSMRNMQHRYVPTTTTLAAEPGPCADVGFRFQGSNVSNVHLVKSSGDASFDKLAVLDVTQQKIPLPAPPSDSAPTNYQIPVCLHN